jgi:ATP-dependent helicase/nuclease subunit A
MESRIFSRLSRWAVMDETTLAEELGALTGHSPTTRMLQSARRLFTEALEDSPGLRIKTIHGFCQSVLARFPLEANVPPNFQVLDDRTASEMLDEARLHLLAGVENADIDTTRLTEALHYLVAEHHEAGFTELLRAVIQQRRTFVRILAQPGGLCSAHERLYKALNVSPHATEVEYRLASFTYSVDEKRDVRRLLEALQDGKKLDGLCASNMRAFVHSDMTDWGQLKDYLSAFLSEGDVRKRLPTSAVLKKDPLFDEIWQKEARRCQHYLHTLRQRDNAHGSAHVLTLAAALFSYYEHSKRLRGLLDYDDLILHTRQLLCDGGQGSLDWVLYKLDGGIDHLLIDEAQDTSAEQWAITQRLVEEFYAGLGARDVERTLFVVGDGKQSIYRFQGAEPEDFHHMRLHLGQQAEHSRHLWREVTMDVSFRSVQAVLDVVDATFALPEVRLRAISDQEHIRHYAYRKAELGRVELWPLTRGDEKEDKEVWPLPDRSEMHTTATHRLAQQIAKTIRQWLDEGRCLEATGMPVRPGDILILVRRRADLAIAITNALRQAGVPVAGLDRMQLNKALAVRDLIALGHVLLLPYDDLSLACVLKSPLYGISEDALFSICYGRDAEPLWERLMGYCGKDLMLLSARDELGSLQRVFQYQGCASPYAFYTELLYARDAMKRFVARMGKGVQEILEVFLEQARTYETSHPPSLQGFLHWLTLDSSDIKRDTELNANEVRIMTVHGAKGLEAPIVFLPETHRSSQNKEITFILHPVGSQEEEVLLQLPASKINDSDLVSLMRQQKASADEEEYFRLLYVAMTRARDELYVCGLASKRSTSLSWYDAIKKAMEAMEGVQLLTTQPEAEPLLVYTRGESKPSATALVAEPPLPSVSSVPALPAYCFEEPIPEPPRQRLLNPSRLMEEYGSAFSPTRGAEPAQDSQGMSAAECGIVMHRLLHILSVISPSQRARIASEYLERYRFRLSVEKREGMLNSLLLLMSDPVYAPIFSPEALSEVSVSGLIEHAEAILGEEGSLALSGQIDRLLVMPERVLVIDFKTGELPQFGPDNKYRIPEIYRRQMEAYRQLLQRIYPKHTIDCALIYTAIPLLLPVSHTLTPQQPVAI